MNNKKKQINGIIPHGKKFKARVYMNNKQKIVGIFTTEFEAKQAQAKFKELHGILPKNKKRKDENKN